MRKVALVIGSLVLNGLVAHTQPGTREQLLTNEPAGPYTVNLYGSVNPDRAGFEVQVGGARGQALNGDLQVRLETGSSQKTTLADAAAQRSGEGFEAQAPTNGDTPSWVRVKIAGPLGYAEITARLEASPVREASRTGNLILLGLLPPAAVGVTLLILRTLRVPVFGEATEPA